MRRRELFNRIGGALVGLVAAKKMKMEPRLPELPPSLPGPPTFMVSSLVMQDYLFTGSSYMTNMVTTVGNPFWQQNAYSPRRLGAAIVEEEEEEEEEEETEELVPEPKLLQVQVPVNPEDAAKALEPRDEIDIFAPNHEAELFKRRKI